MRRFYSQKKKLSITIIACLSGNTWMAAGMRKVSCSKFRTLALILYRNILCKSENNIKCYVLARILTCTGFLSSQTIVFCILTICYSGFILFWSYFVRHPCKMFVRGKPIRFGYKLWCLSANPLASCSSSCRIVE